ncbi:unnamed protein product [Meganyctiphanes norvegica]|uniref:C-type lectin domain-containing protein n=1 Tax=Meganyctiphanes norvegica TaxID=48144 RepID=A0AAV2QFK5_MEGNR
MMKSLLLMIILQAGVASLHKAYLQHEPQKAHHGKQSDPLDCSEPWVEIKVAGCLLFQHLMADWDAAREICLELGGDLAVLEGNDQRWELAQYMANHSLVGMWYMGGNDRVGYWKWLNGQHIVDGWAFNQPNEDRGDDTCIYFQLSNFGFWDTPCTNLNNALCQKPYIN